MASAYRLIVARTDGEPVVLVPGGRHEHDFVQDIVSHINVQTLLDRIKNVGVLRTEAQVLSVVQSAFDTLLGPMIHKAVHAAIHAVKAEVKP